MLLRSGFLDIQIKARIPFFPVFLKVFRKFQAVGRGLDPSPSALLGGLGQEQIASSADAIRINPHKPASRISKSSSLVAFRKASLESLSLSTPKPCRMVRRGAPFACE